MTVLTRSFGGGKLVTRAEAGTGGDERIVEGVVVPFGAIASVQDPGGPRYRETIAPGAAAAGGTDWSAVKLDYLRGGPRPGPNTHDGAVTVGRALSGSEDDAAASAAFRVSRTASGDEAYELARDGVLTDFSVAFEPIAERKRADGVIERTAIRVHRVAILEAGVYGNAGAKVTAVRAAQEGTMGENATAPADGAETGDEAEDDAATKPATKDQRVNRTRVTVDVERAKIDERQLLERQAADRRDLMERQAAEREAVVSMTRGSSIRITRPGAVYGPDSEHFFLRDQFRASTGDWDAAQRVQRHAGLLQETADVIERAAAWDWQTGELKTRQMARPRLLERAGDVVSSEIPGAYPTDFVPGLLTPRILKGRPMGDTYDRFPIADARPRTFPKVTTSTVVAVQSAEGAALSSTDFATTAVTVTPLMYGAFTDVSRQTIDGADPVAQSMLLQDLNEAYAQASEAVIKTAVEAGSTASGVAITAATPYAGTLANVINYYGVRFKGSSAAFIPSALFPVLAAQGDTTGRPFLPMIGAVNSDGTTLADDLSLELPVLTARTKLSYSSTVNVCVFARPTDFVTFESSIATFSFEQVVGPQAVRVGIWAYLVVGARLGSLKVTAA